MPKLRALVVGCGRIGSEFGRLATLAGIHSHAEAYARHPRTELVAVVDADARKARAAGRLWHVPSATDPLPAVREFQPDLVSLCTPDETHFPLARDLVKQGGLRALLVEKPLALKSSEAAELVRLCRRHKVALGVNYLRRLSPAFQQIRDELRAGKHGKLVLARFTYGKGLVHNGSHALDLLRFWFGEPATLRVTSTTREPDGQRAFDAELRYPWGGRAVLTCFPESVATVFEGDFLCEKSRWQFALGGAQWRFFTKQSAMFKGYTNYVETPRRDHAKLFSSPLKDSLSNAVDNLVRHIERGDPLLCSGEDGLAVLRQTEKLLA